MPETTEPTAVYRYFDANDVLLYVGISTDPDERWKAHRYGLARKTWPKEAIRRTDQWCSSRPEALQVEEEAIKSERPLYNGTHNHDDAAFDPTSWPTAKRGRTTTHVAALIRDEITSRRWVKGQRLPSVRAMAEAVGASQNAISKASALLQREGLLVFESGRGLFVADKARRKPTLPASEPTRTHRRESVKLPHDWPRSVGFPG